MRGKAHGFPMSSNLINRNQKAEVLRKLELKPAVALYGPSQAGKTTLGMLIAHEAKGVYLDCGSPKVKANLKQHGINFYTDKHPEKLIVLDEVGTQPDLLPRLRGVIDERRRQGFEAGCFLLLGEPTSAEALSGRLAKVRLDPLDVLEMPCNDDKEIERLWLRGGFPDSFIASNGKRSFEIREAYTSALESNIITPEGLVVYSHQIERLHFFLAHNHGHDCNFSSVAHYLGMDTQAVIHCIDRLRHLFIARTLFPHSPNLSKELAKAPRFYYRDSGLVHQLLGIDTIETLNNHPIKGRSWEGFVIENILRQIPNEIRASFHRPYSKGEIDLIIEAPGEEIWAIEIKKKSRPSLSRGFHFALETLKPAPTRTFLVHGGKFSRKRKSGIECVSLRDMCREVAAKFRTSQEEDIDANQDACAKQI